ncbi:MAG: hypothetical protein JW847_03295 [Candidatus Omnitrophica bacterium]|nr:hypothetical protein [Candidatus Omnitrophota bacterium]
MPEAAFLSLPLILAGILTEEKRRKSKNFLFVIENLSCSIASNVIDNAINVAGSIFIGQPVTFRFVKKWQGITSREMTYGIFE